MTDIAIDSICSTHVVACPGCKAELFLFERSSSRTATARRLDHELAWANAAEEAFVKRLRSPQRREVLAEFGRAVVSLPDASTDIA